MENINKMFLTTQIVWIIGVIIFCMFGFGFRFMIGLYVPFTMGYLTLYLQIFIPYKIENRK